MLGWSGSTGFAGTGTSWSRTERFAGDKAIWRAKEVLAPAPHHSFSCFADVLTIKLVSTDSFARPGFEGNGRMLSEWKSCREGCCCCLPGLVNCSRLKLDWASGCGAIYSKWKSAKKTVCMISKQTLSVQQHYSC